LEKFKVLRQAGAGAGKTTGLVKDVKEYFFNHFSRQQSYPRIVVTTFTKKAAHEIKERIIRCAIEVGDAHFLRAASSQKSIVTTTIDGLCYDFLNRVRPNLNVIEQIELVSERFVQKEAMLQLKSLIGESRQKYDPSNADSFEFQELLEIYGYRGLVLHLLEYARQKIETPILRPLDIELHKIYLGRIVSVAVSQIEELLRLISPHLKESRYSKIQEHLLRAQVFLKKDLDSWTSKDQCEIEWLCTSSFRKSTKASDPDKLAIDEIIPELKKNVVILRNHLSKKDNSELFLRCNVLFDKLAQRFFEGWWNSRMISSQVSVSELAPLCLLASQKFPEALEEFRREVDLWIVDEFQDTNPLQMRIFNLWISDKSCVFVGDPQQSIYFFRGARREVFEGVKAEFKASQFKLETLSKNYRSQGRLVHVFNQIFSGLSAFTPMEPANKSGEGSTSDLHLEVCLDFSDEVLSIKSHIASLVASGASYEDIVILSRSNSDLVEIGRHLKLDKIPVFVHARKGFKRRREVKDLALFCRFLFEPENDIVLFGLLRSPWFHIEDTSFIALRKLWPKSDSLFDFLSRSLTSNEARLLDELLLLKFQELIRIYNIFLGSGLSSALYEFLQSRGVLSTSFAIDSTGVREANIWKIVHMLKDGSYKEASQLETLLDSILDRVEDRESDSDAPGLFETNRVQLMTIHASKGLQFEHVLVSRAGKGLRHQPDSLLPVDDKSGAYTLILKSEIDGEIVHNWITQSHAELKKASEKEEFSRFLYVALTRAKQSLWVTMSPSSKLIPEPPHHWKLGDHLDMSDLIKFSFEKSSWAETIIGSLSDYSREQARFHLALSAGEKLSKVWSSQQDGSSSLPSEEPAPELSDPEAPLLRAPESLFVSQRSEPERDDSFLNLSVSAFLNKDERESWQRKRVSTLGWLERLNARVFGNKVHRLMEILQKTESDPAHITQQLFESEDQYVLDALNYLFEQEEFPFVQLMKSGKAEFPFSFVHEGHLLSGAIDLCGFTDAGYWIVDYKTGDEAKVDKARKQLELYSEATSQIWKGSKCHLVAVYPFSKKCFRLNWHL